MDNSQSEQPKKKGRGFASMSPEKQREIASRGGKSAHAKGTAHKWTSEEAKEAGKKGGAKRAKKYAK
jgi:general stress protein YciG